MYVWQKFQLVFPYLFPQQDVSLKYQSHGDEIIHYKTNCPDWVTSPRLMWEQDALSYYKQHISSSMAGEMSCYSLTSTF